MDLFLNISAIALLIWAGLKIIDFIIEMFSALGGDGVQPYDIMWWISRPISMRGWYLFKLPMLLGLLAWLLLIWGTYWAVGYLFQDDYCNRHKLNLKHMGTILGKEYSETRYNEFEEKEYYIDDWNDWYTEEEIREELKEIDYWVNDFPRECEGDDDDYDDDYDDDDDDDDDDEY